MTTKHEIIGRSRKEKSKPKNGDFFKYKVLGNELLVLTVADGVSSNNCDWLASQTSCEKFIEVCELKLKKRFSEKDLVKICDQVNEALLHTSAKCRGMLSVFSAVIWDTDNNFFHFINAGDTRIYKINNNKMRQVSTDETKDVIVRNKQGKCITFAGTTVVRTGITNALGRKDFKANIDKCDFTYGDSIILASDGFYDCKTSFEADILKSCQSSDLENLTDKYFTQYSDYQTDDMTILILRRNDIDEELKKDYKTIHDFDKIKGSVAKHTLIELLHAELLMNIKRKNKQDSVLILEKMQENSLFLTQNQYDELLKICTSSGFKDRIIYLSIIGQIRIVNKNY
jgi:serine/threonine protein phosphatase PrpC